LLLLLLVLLLLLSNLKALDSKLTTLFYQKNLLWPIYKNGSLAVIEDSREPYEFSLSQREEHIRKKFGL